MVMLLCAVCVAGYLVYTHQIPVPAALAPPR